MSVSNAMTMTTTTIHKTSITTTMLVTTYSQSMFVHVSHNMTLGSWSKFVHDSDHYGDVSIE